MLGIPALVGAELRLRLGQAAATVLVVAVVVGIAVGSHLLLVGHDRATEAAAAAKEEATLRDMEDLQEEVRRLTVALGFNLLILPRDQPLAEVFGQGAGSRTMPEEHGRRLAAARPDTINHLLPALQGRLPWTERGTEVLISGVLGELWIKGARQKPIQHAIAPGEVVVGAELARSLGLAAGQQITLQGQALTIAGIQAGRGGTDDVALVMHLALAQQLLGKPGQINVIYGLECECGPETLAAARREVAGILPDVQVVELSRIAAARASARNQAQATARAAATREREGRNQQRAERARLVGLLVPAVALAGLLVTMALAWLNVRERRSEIGLLRALGRGGAGIAGLFLVRASLLGGLGGLGGLLAAGLAAHSVSPLLRWADLADPRLLLLVAAGSIGFAALAALLPALAAVARDPSDILREA